MKTEMPKKLSKREARAALVTQANLIVDAPSSAIQHFLGNTWMASERLPKDKTAELGSFGGWFAWHMACAFHNIALVELMLQNGAPVNALNSDGSNAIMLATDPGLERDPTPIVNLLLHHGCSIDAVDNEGRGVLYRNPAEIPKLLFRQLLDEGAPVNCYDANGAHLLANLIESIENDDVKRDNVQLLLDAPGLNIEACQGWGSGDGNALAAALRSGCFDVADALVDLGCDVRRRNNTGANLFHQVWEPKAFDWLAERVPELLDQPDYQGVTPVMTLASRIGVFPDPRFLKMLSQFIEAGVDLDRMGHHRDEPSLSVRLLLERNSHPDVEQVWKGMMARQTANAALGEIDQSGPRP